jgi:hypothetical protein
MVKKLRQTNVSGLTRFLQAFDEPSHSQTASATPSAGPSTPRLKRESNSIHPETQKAAGKRKAGLLGPGNEAYDATGLVPFYTDAAQVPAHLQKCTYVRALMNRTFGSRVIGVDKCRFCSANTLLFEIRRGLLVGRGRVVQRDARGHRDAGGGAVSV